MRPAIPKTNLLFFIFCFLFNFIFISALRAQEPERCLTDQFHAEKMQNPAFAADWNARMAARDMYLKNHKDEAKANCDEILYLPVAVHFEDVDIDYACAVDMALSQIDRLNADYGATNTDLNKFTDNQATWPGTTNKASCIRFCLATMNHPAESGIANGQYAVTLNQYDNTVENAPEWAGYINFYIRSVMPGGTLGYSPLGGTGNGDGVVIGLQYFGSVSCGGNTIDATYSMGRTATHEVGHYLSLEHPFGNDCVTDNDGIADTPITNDPTYGCFADGEEFINCDDPVLWPDYMDYCDDPCMYMFTTGQVNQMEAYVNTSLTELLNSATIRCEEAACLDYAVNFIRTNESCEGNDGAILLNASGGAAPYTYSINNGTDFAENGNFTNLPAGDYPVLVADQGSCEFRDTISIVRVQPVMELTSVNPAFCGDNSGSLSVKVKYNASFTYQIEGVTGWQDTTYFPNLTAGTYLVKARTENGCTSSLEVVVPDNTDLSMIIRSVKPVNCPLFENGEIILDVSNAEPPVVWRLDDNPPTDQAVYKNLGPGTYQVSVQDGRGCHLEKKFNIGVSFLEIGEDCPCQVFIPNAMTPDGDGLNDLLDIVPSCPISDFKLQVFDRYGRVIFTSTSLSEKWNGGNGEYYMPNGVYPYLITYRWGEKRNESLEVQILRGYVTVLR